MSGSSDDGSSPAMTITDVLETFFGALTRLASDDGYKEVESIVGGIPSLKEQISSRDAELEELRAEIEKLKLVHEGVLQANLGLYRAEHNKLNEEKDALSKNVSDLTQTVQERDGALAELNTTHETLQGKHNDLNGEKDALSENVSSLTQTIQQRDDTIAELNTTQATLRTQLEETENLLDGEKEKVATATTTIATLQQSIKEKDADIDESREMLNEEKIQLANTERMLNDSQKEILSLKKNLLTNTARVAELEGFTVELHEEDEETLITRLDELWEAACRLVEDHFKEDLPEECLEDHSAWKRLKESLFLDRPIPLPQSNTPAAKQMRIAAMLAITARCVNQYIFQPTYILDEESGIRELLVRQAVVNSKKESHCRALLLSMFPEEQARNAIDKVDRVVREIVWHVQDLLSVTQIESFRADLEQFARSASETWKTIQHATERYEPSFHLNHYEDLEWQPLIFDESGPAAGDGIVMNGNGHARDEELLVIFPRIYIVDDHEPDPITPGVVLMRSQSLLAAQEVDRRKPTSPANGKSPNRPRPPKGRRMSISVNGKGSFSSQGSPPPSSNGHGGGS